MNGRQWTVLWLAITAAVVAISFFEGRTYADPPKQPVEIINMQFFADKPAEHLADGIYVWRMQDNGKTFYLVVFKRSGHMATHIMH